MWSRDIGSRYRFKMNVEGDLAAEALREGSEVVMGDSDATAYYVVAVDDVGEIPDQCHGGTYTEVDGTIIFICTYCGRNFEDAPLLDKHMEEEHGVLEPGKSLIADEMAMIVGDGEVTPVDNFVQVGDERFESSEDYPSVELMIAITNDKTGETSSPPVDDDDDSGGKILRSSKRVRVKTEEQYFTPESLICSVCGKTFDKPWNVKRHEAIHHKKVTCGSCGEVFPSKAQRAVHLRKVHEVNADDTVVFECDVCGKGFGSKYVLARHKRIHNDVRPFMCSECGRTFNQSCHLRSHEEVHKTKTFKCKCGRRFKTETSLKSHEKNFHSGLKHLCDMCGSTFTSANGLKRHVKHSHGEDGKEKRKQKQTEKQEETSSKVIVCPTCRSPLRSYYAYRVHCATVHQDERMKFNCELCNKQFYYYSLLQRHLRSHDDERPFECNVCGKRFHQSAHLAYHNSVHLLKKDFTCPICKKSFARSNSVRDHMKVHQGVRPHLCDFCGKDFITQSGLRQHRVTHTQNKQFDCNLCSKSFYQVSTLKQHMSVHSWEKPYKCECGRSFKRASHLQVHRKIHSGENIVICDGCGIHCSSRSSLLRHQRKSCKNPMRYSLMLEESEEEEEAADGHVCGIEIEIVSQDQESTAMVTNEDRII